ncbi:ankyrin repeat domain-containing protein [Chryseobacterium sp.]|uniref:ankyrin repeat domain-containing protein n=1 Tax=Chryseobacterium sp. TaxID=1871047 RepID=UPI002FC6E412
MKKFFVLIFCVFFSVVKSQNLLCEKLKNAILKEDVVEFKKIIKTKVDVNCISKNEHTPLGIACSRGNIDFVKILLENKANPNIPQYYKGEPLGTSLFDALRFCEQQLEPKLVDVTQLNLKKKKKKLEKCNNDIKDNITKLLIKNGANVKFVDSNKTTALMIASMYGRSEILKLLLNKGVNINARDNDGNTALIYASSNNDYTSVNILILAGADVLIKGNDGKTALDIANENKFEKIKKLLSSK